MSRMPSSLTPTYWIATAALLAGALAMLVYYAPVEATMGEVQKIFYIHLPSAICTFGACAVVFFASIAYLWQRESVWDDLAHAAAHVAVLFCGVVLVTGMLWAHSAWGHWWTWSPRLTFSLILLLLFAVYLVVRPAIESPQKRAIVSAVYGTVAFLDVPLVYLSVKLLPDIHPSDVSLDPAMRLTLAAWFVPIVMIAGGLLWAKFRLNVRQRQAHEQHDLESFSGREVHG